MFMFICHVRMSIANCLSQWRIVENKRQKWSTSENVVNNPLSQKTSNQKSPSMSSTASWMMTSLETAVFIRFRLSNESVTTCIPNLHQRLSRNGTVFYVHLHSHPKLGHPKLGLGANSHNSSCIGVATVRLSEIHRKRIYVAATGSASFRILFFRNPQRLSLTCAIALQTSAWRQGKLTIDCPLPT